MKKIIILFIIFNFYGNLFALNLPSKLPTIKFDYFPDTIEEEKLIDFLENQYTLRILDIDRIAGNAFLITTFRKKEYMFKYLGTDIDKSIYVIRVNFYLKEHGININGVVTTIRNEELLNLNNHYYVLYEYSNDFNKSQIENYFEMGKVLAQMDNLLFNFKYPNVQNFFWTIFNFHNEKIHTNLLANSKHNRELFVSIFEMYTFLSQNEKYFVRVSGNLVAYSTIHEARNQENLDLMAGNFNNQYRALDLGETNYR